MSGNDDIDFSKPPKGDQPSRMTPPTPRQTPSLTIGRGADRPTSPEMHRAKNLVIERSTGTASSRETDPAEVEEVALHSTSEIATPRIVKDNPREHEKEAVDLGPEYNSLDLPSGFIPYSFPALYIRPLRVSDLSRVAVATENNSFSALLDALDLCINQNIRDLTYSDFMFCMYWLRLNSYIKSPFSFKWTSRYGNTNEIVVNSSNLEVKRLSLTQDEYNEYVNMGICIPTIRDMEAKMENGGDEESVSKFSDEQKWLLERAQFVYLEEITSDWIDRKLEILDSKGMDFLEEIREYEGLIEHGVIETVEVVDKKFEAEKAIADFQERINDLERASEQLKAEPTPQSASSVAVLAEAISDMAEELEEMKAKVEKGESVEPRKETTQISVSALSFFPNI